MHSSIHGRRTRRLAGLLSSALILTFAAPALAQVDEIVIGVLKEDLGGGAMWRFHISVDTDTVANLPNSGTVTPPMGGNDITLMGDAEEIEFESAPFASFAALQAVYPAGDYAFDIGVGTVMLNWDPTDPTGTQGEPSLTITSPADGSLR
jgi:hypothetical protein